MEMRVKERRRPVEWFEVWAECDWCDVRLEYVSQALGQYGQVDASQHRYRCPTCRRETVLAEFYPVLRSSPAITGRVMYE
jgi:hypothetical protein